MIKNSSILAISCITALLFSACTKSPEDIIEERVKVELDVSKRSSLSHFKNIFSLIEMGSTLSQEDLNNGLRYSIEFNYPEFALFFIERGADINGSVFYADGKVKFDTTMLGFASRLNQIEFVRMLLEKGANIDSVLFPGEQTPLMQLASIEKKDADSQYEEVFKYLLEKGASVTSQDKNGKTLLFLLLENRNLNLAKLALAHGAKIETRTPNGKSLLVYASERADKEMVDFLLNEGSDINEICKNTNPLFSVLQRGDRSEFAEYLVKKGANIDCGNMLMTFSKSNRIDAVKFLLEHGADVNLGSAWETVLTSKNADLISLFLKYNADPNLVLSNGQRALDFSIEQGLDNVAKDLINAGADTSNFVRIDVCEIPMEDFSIGKFEVTQKQYKSIMGKIPKGIKYSDNDPVVNVSWSESNEFCKKLTKIAHLLNWIPQDWIYTLPSDYQWSCACGIFRNDEKYIMEQIAWYGKNSGNRIHEVGKKNKGTYGTYDQAGNVWEWTFEKKARGGSFACQTVSFLKTESYRDSFISRDLGFRIALVPEITNSVRQKKRDEFLSKIEKLKNPNTTIDGESLLIHAICSIGWSDGLDNEYSIKILEALIKKGYNPNIKDKLGMPAIVLATGPSFMFKPLSRFERVSNECAFDFARILLNAGADVNSNFQGVSPLTLAVNLQDVELAEFLLKNGADKKFIPKTNSCEDTRKIAPPPWELIRIFSKGHRGNVTVSVDDGSGDIYEGTFCSIPCENFRDHGNHFTLSNIDCRHVFYLIVWKNHDSRRTFSLERERFLGRLPMDVSRYYGDEYYVIFDIKDQLSPSIVGEARARGQNTIASLLTDGCSEIVEDTSHIEQGTRLIKRNVKYPFVILHKIEHARNWGDSVFRKAETERMTKKNDCKDIN